MGLILYSHIKHIGGECSFKHFGKGRSEITRKGRRIGVWRDGEGGKQGGQYDQNCIKMSL